MLPVAAAVFGFATPLVQLLSAGPIQHPFPCGPEIVGVDFACSTWSIHFDTARASGVPDEEAIDRFHWLRDGSYRSARIDVDAGELVLEPSAVGAEGEAEVVFVRSFHVVTGARWITSFGARVEGDAALFVDARALRFGTWSEWVSLGRSGAEIEGEAPYVAAGLCVDAEGLHLDPLVQETQVRLRARAARLGARVHVSEFTVSSVDPGRAAHHTPQGGCSLAPAPKQGLLALALPADDEHARLSECASRRRLLTALAARRGVVLAECELARLASLERSPAEVVDGLRAAGLTSRARFFALFHEVANVLNGERALVVEVAPAPGMNERLATPQNARHWVALLGLLPGYRVEVLDPARDGADARFVCTEEELAARWMRTCGVGYVVRCAPE
ncbi:MAG: hypothetical protein IPJ77_03320 [Planctomycetes bacterium]|nr:hypothetical protein [Planctomycetota bacterium]